MNLSLPFRGQSVDIKGLTAVPSDERKDKRYIGNGSDDEKLGAMEPVAPVEYDLPLNGTYDIPPGEHMGGDVVRQGIASRPGEYVTPGSGQIVVECAGKYMTGDIIILAVENLTSDNIKYGVVVGEGEGAVTGTCQGFFD